MAALYGIMGLNDVKNMTVQTIGQRMVFDAVNQLVDQYNRDLEEMLRFFVAETTTEPQITYMMPGGGMMQESTELSRPGAVKPPLGWPVGFEIRDARDQVAWDDVALAYATVEHVEATTNNIMIRHANWVRYNIMRRLFANTSYTFADPLFGNITVQPLANGDATIYPPLVGATGGATDNHFIASNMASLSDVNNPIPTYVEELAEHGSGGEIVMLAHPTQVAQMRAMASFIDIADPTIRVVSGVEAVYSGPDVPGTIVGKLGDAWVSEWRWQPAGYVFLRDTGAPAPLVKRIDRVDLPGRGELELVAVQQEFPFIGSFWRDRHGFGVGNRLNGVIGQITGAAYSVPALYA